MFSANKQINKVVIYPDFLNNSSPIADGDRNTAEIAVLGMLRQPRSGDRGFMIYATVDKVGSS